MGGDNRENIIKQIAGIVRRIKKPVADAARHKELKIFEGMEKVEYMPTPFEIADFYGIKYKFVELSDEMPSYLSQGLGIIYISNAYPKESYMARILCAHELGHFFLHDASQPYAMNNDSLNEYLPEEVQKEYEANIFSVLLMPQIMAEKTWESFSPQKLNREVYKKIVNV